MTWQEQIPNTKTEKKEIDLEDLMRLLANKIIDRVLEDRKQGITRG